MKKYYCEIKPQLIRNFVDSIIGSGFLNSIFTLFIFLFLNGSLLNGQSPVAVNGKLSVSGTQLVNKNGTPIQLRGMSSHGTQWYTEDYNFNSLSVLANKWGIDVFRIAMYPSDKPDATKNAYEGNPTFWKSYVDNLVDICGSLGIYCIIDWHVLTPGDPNDPTYLPMAKEFWDYMSKKHAGKNQVLYEICNEPNGVAWATVKAYANIIIPIIRANDPNSVIIVGSPTWSSDVDIAANDPIKDPADPTKLAANVMYTFHFYAASHGQNYRDKITAALGKGLAIFVTEWGSTDASGGGTSNWTETQTWMDFLATNKISWANWSYSDKSETSAVLQPGSGAALLWDNTNAQGDKIKTYIASPADSWTSTGNWNPAAYIATPLNGDYFLPNTTITLTSTAVDKDGTIASVDFLVDGVKIGTATTAPYSVQWTPTTVKDYVVTTIAKDNAGATGTSLPFTYHVVSSINQTAYPSGTPWAISNVVGATTTLECLNFDNGGEMIAYHDIDAVHKGPSGSSRPTEGVDVEGTSDIGYVLTGEWLEYTINVATKGTYDISLNYASAIAGGGKFHFESNGLVVSPVVSAPATGGWGSYMPATASSVSLPAGQQVLRLYIDQGNINFSTLVFKRVSIGPTYTITASAGTGGVISPSGATTVASGDNATFTISAVPGYSISDLKVDGTSVAITNPYVFTNVTANHTISVSFSGAPLPNIALSKPVTVSSVEDTGYPGSNAVDGNTSTRWSSSFNDNQWIQIDLQQTYTIQGVSLNWEAASGKDYRIDISNDGTTWTTVKTMTSMPAGARIDPISGLSGAGRYIRMYGLTRTTPYGFSLYEFEVNGTLNGTSYTINASAGAGGTITPSGAVTVSSGNNQTFTIAPTSGNKIADIKVDGTSVGAVTSYTFSNVTANHTIAATFVALPTYTITATAGTGGTINPSGTVVVTEAANQTFNITALSGYKINDVIVDGTSVGAVATYTFASVIAGHTITASFVTVPTYTITATAGTGGNISPSGTIVVSSGSSQTFTITAASCHIIKSIIVDGISQTVAGTYTFTNVTANHSISVTFDALIYTSTASAGSGGKITPSGPSIVNCGNNQNYTITPDSGYRINDVVVDGVSQGAITTYTFTNISANHTISATFVPNSGCSLLTLFGVPRTSALPTIANSSFSHAYVLGTGGPSLTNVTTFTINWDLPNNGLWQFSFNTNNGVPSWWVDLLPKITKNLNVASPSLKITGSGISGLDGDYWVTLDGTNFVMVSKTGSFAIYGSSSATPPATCATKSAIAVSSGDEMQNSGLSVYPSPVEKGSTAMLTLNHVSETGTLILISDMSGRMIQRMTVRETLVTIPIDGKFSNGIYNITVIDQSNVSNTKLMVK